ENLASKHADRTGEDQAIAAGDDPELSDSEERAVRELTQRDNEVRQHEQAHKAAAGDLATSGPSYTYQTGPDGKRYAIGGEVQVRLQTGSTPEETMRKMERAVRAAHAPHSPSGPDRAVAAQAMRMMTEAQQQVAQERAQAAGDGSTGQKRVNVVA